VSKDKGRPVKPHRSGGGRRVEPWPHPLPNEEVGQDGLSYEGGGRVSVSVDSILNSPKVQRQVAVVREIEAAGQAGQVHPEAFCQECHRPNAAWFAPNEIWNAVSPDDGILCPVCFIRKAESAGFTGAWKLQPEFYESASPLASSDPDGHQQAMADAELSASPIEQGELAKFDYLLSAFEQASQSEEPYKLGYGAKRRALLEYVSALRRPVVPQGWVMVPEEPTKGHAGRCIQRYCMA
jgi:hypothetical protein